MLQDAWVACSEADMQHRLPLPPLPSRLNSTPTCLPSLFFVHTGGAWSKLEHIKGSPPPPADGMVPCFMNLSARLLAWAVPWWGAMQERLARVRQSSGACLQVTCPFCSGDDSIALGDLCTVVLPGTLEFHDWLPDAGFTAAVEDLRADDEPDNDVGAGAMLASPGAANPRASRSPVHVHMQTRATVAQQHKTPLRRTRSSITSPHTHI